MNFDNKYCAAGLAGIYIEEGNDELAEKYLIERTEYRVYTPDTYIMYARLLVGKGDVKNSLLNLYKAKQYLLTRSQLGLILNIRGLAYSKSNDLYNALKKYKEAILYMPEHPGVREDMGLVYGEMGYHAKAIESFKKAIRLQSKSETIYYNLALAYILNNECQKAVTLLDRKGFRENKSAKELLERAKKCLGNGQ
jgi:Flp pilus assembly protein TadD